MHEEQNIKKKLSGRLPHFNSSIQQALGKRENIYKIFSGNPEEKKSLEDLAYITIQCETVKLHIGEFTYT